MSNVGKYFIYVFAAILIGLVAFWYLGRGFIENSIKEDFLKATASQFDTVTLQSLELNSLFPIEVSLKNLVLKKDNLTLDENSEIKVQLMYFDHLLSFFNKPLMVKLQVNNANFSMLTQAKDSTTPPAVSSPATALSSNILPFPLGLEASIQNSSFTTFEMLVVDEKPVTKTQLQISDINMQFKQDLLMAKRIPIFFDLNANVSKEWAGVKYRIPLLVSTQEGYFSESVLSAKNVNVSFSGINMAFKEGVSDFVKQSHEWSTSFAMPDLSKMPSFVNLSM